MNRSIPCAVFLAALGLLAACGSGKTTAPDNGASKETPECASYQRELRACFAAVGAPTVAADTLAVTLSQSDEPTRLSMESDCARDRARLRTSCK